MKNIALIFYNQRILITFLLGFSSGLPLPLVWGTLKGWLTSEGVDLKTVGIFSLVTYPYSMKFLWAPFLDRFSFPFLHRRTGWMVVIQLLLVVSIILLGKTDPIQSVTLVGVLGIFVAFLSASQDIVIDAYRIELLRPEELGAGAAVATAGARIGLLISGAFAFVLSDHMPWSRVYAIMACLMSVGLLTAFFAPEPTNPSKPPRTVREAMIEPFKSFFERTRALEILVFIVVFKLGDVLAGEMLTPFLIKVGYSRTMIGTLNKGFGMISTIVGSLVAGGVVSRLGIWKSLLLFGTLQPFSNLLFVLLANSQQSYPLLVLCIGVENFCTGMGSTAFVAFIMSLCDKRYTGTHFALLSSVMALSRPFVGSSTGYLAESLGWAGYFFLSAVLAVPGILLLFRFRKEFSASSLSGVG